MSNQTEIETLISYPHHNMLKYCENRPKYRQGRKLRAIKVLVKISHYTKMYPWIIILVTKSLKIFMDYFPNYINDYALQKQLHFFIYLHSNSL